MRFKSNILFILVLSFALCIINFSFSSCWMYSFNEKGTIPDSIKTVRVNFIENKAPYVNPQLSPALTDRLKQKISSQTRLTSTTSDNAHYDISCTITDYSVSTSGVSNTNGRSQGSTNRLSVSVHIVLNNQLANQTQEYDANYILDFSASQTLQQVESSRLDEIVRNLSDQIFNRIFSNW